MIRQVLSLMVVFAAALPAGALDLGRAVVLTPAGLSAPEKRAVRMLVEEAEKRTRLRWAETATWPDAGGPVIAVGPVAALSQFAGPKRGQSIVLITP